MPDERVWGHCSPVLQQSDHVISPVLLNVAKVTNATR